MICRGGREFLDSFTLEIRETLKEVTPKPEQQPKEQPKTIENISVNLCYLFSDILLLVTKKKNKFWAKDIIFLEDLVILETSWDTHDQHLLQKHWISFHFLSQDVSQKYVFFFQTLESAKKFFLLCSKATSELFKIY